MSLRHTLAYYEKAPKFLKGKVYTTQIVEGRGRQKTEEEQVVVCKRKAEERWLHRALQTALYEPAVYTALFVHKVAQSNNSKHFFSLN